MARKGLLVCVGIFGGLALLGPWLTPGERIAAVPSDVPIRVEEPVDSVPTKHIEREPVAATIAPSPERVAPWLLRIFVVDDEDRPIAGSAVMIRALDTAIPTPSCELLTDGAGRAQTTLSVGAVTVSARASGHAPGEAQSYRHDLGRQGELRLELSRPAFVHGFVLHADRAPANGARVTARVTEYEARREPDAMRPVTTGRDGRFVVPIRRDAEYEFVAELDGVRSSSGTVAAHARESTELVLVFPSASTLGASIVDGKSKPVTRVPALVAIRGRIEHEDGTPFAGVRVGASVEKPAIDADATGSDREAGFVSAPDAMTSSDGSFVVQVQPGRTWTLWTRPDPTSRHSWIERPGIASGRDDVVVRISSAEFAGCTVEGTVTRSDRQPPGPCQVEIVRHANGTSHTLAGVVAKVEDGHFTLPALSLGGRFTVRVYPISGDGPGGRASGPLAPAEIGPFVADRAQMHLEFHLEPWSALRVRVLGLSGLPVRNLRVNLKGGPPLGFVGQIPLDSEGRVVFERRAAGEHVLQVRHDATLVLEQRVQLVPGATRELEVRVPESPQGR